MIIIEQTKDAGWLNGVVNHPEVYRDLAYADGPIDVTENVKSDRNVLLRGACGGMLFIASVPGQYEVHTAILPEGRGPWAGDFIKTCLSWMFVNTDAFDIATRVPEGHIAAKAATLRSGARFEFTTNPGSMWRGKMTPMHTYSLFIKDWLARADELDSLGVWVHERMKEEAHRLGISNPPHEHEDDMHYRVVAACFLMAQSGFLPKGVSIYNRWAVLARHSLVYMMDEPNAIRMDLGIMKFVNGDIEVKPWS